MGLSALLRENSSGQQDCFKHFRGSVKGWVIPYSQVETFSLYYMGTKNSTQQWTSVGRYFIQRFKTFTIRSPNNSCKPYKLSQLCWALASSLSCIFLWFQSFFLLLAFRPTLPADQFLNSLVVLIQQKPPSWLAVIGSLVHSLSLWAKYWSKMESELMLLH